MGERCALDECEQCALDESILSSIVLRGYSAFGDSRAVEVLRGYSAFGDSRAVEVFEAMLRTVVQCSLGRAIEPWASER